MDQDRFDHLTRKFASRRSVLKGLTGALAGAVVGLGRKNAADARGPRRRGQTCSMSTGPCGSCLICLDGRCAPTDFDSRCAETECGTCAHGVCIPDQSRCHSCEHCLKSLTCKSLCDADEICCEGRCHEKGTCCTQNNDCDRCQMCDNGECVTDPHEEGKQCSSCKVCEAGACSKEDPDLYCGDKCCPEGQFCAGNVIKECCDIENFCNGLVSQDCCTNGNVCTQDGGCCPSYLACGPSDGGFGHGQHKECCDADATCIDNACCPHDRTCGDRCCAEGDVCDGNQCCKACGDIACCGEQNFCIDGGLFVDNACCDTSISGNVACGSNGDGTYRDCCDRNEECCNDKCVAKGCCDNGTFAAASDVCCEAGHVACNDDCCDAGQQCCGGYCCSGPCDAAGADCCPSDQTCGDTCCDGPCDATGAACCPPDQTCGDSCCPVDQQCCNGSCQESCGDCEPGDVPCDMTSTSYGAIMCCGAGSQCCPGNLLWYCGPNPDTGLCCAAGEQECAHECCGAGQFCDLGICCDLGQEPCAFDGKAICCNEGQVCRYDGPSAPYCF